MDADGTRSKGIARALRKLGVKACNSCLTQFFSTILTFKNFLNKLFLFVYNVTEAILDARWV